MDYTFPNIYDIDDVLWAIEGRDEFVVADKGTYTIINYNVQMADTFLDPAEEGISIQEAVTRATRRECRGITFCNETGEIIRRPFQKFKNVNEADETQLHRLDFSKEHWIDTKLDGSMISPMLVNGEIYWGTKMCAPDFHDLVLDFVCESPVDYVGFCHEVIEAGFTPIFEFMHPKKRIVIDYGKEPALTLLAVRHMVTGGFINNLTGRFGICDAIREYNIPVVEQHGSVEDPKAFMQYVHELKNAEGFVIRWADGHRVKIKAHEYIQIHKAKEAILQDRNIVELILEEHLDDVKAHLPAEDRDRLTQFESDINRRIRIVVQEICNIMYDLTDRDLDRKTFALEEAPKLDPFIRPIVFKNFDGCTVTKIYEDIHNTLRNNLGRTVKYEAIRDAWFPGVVYND